MTLNRIRQIVLLATFAAGGAYAEEFTPAKFAKGELTVTNMLRVPIERPPGRYDVSLTCQVIVETDGATTSPHCLADSRYRSFQWEVVKAVSSTTMEPATVDGEAVRVLMNFMVGFRCREGCDALVINNHANHIKELGVGYTSPQPVLEEGVWYEGYEQKLVWILSDRGAEEVGGIRYVVSTRVNEKGKSSRRRVVQESVGFRRSADRAARSLGGVRYIPAFHEGQPLEMELYEYWLDPDGTPPETISIAVRVHMLSSEFVESLDSMYTDDEVERFFDSMNTHWRQAGIQWKVESIVHVDAERQLGYRRVTRPDSTAEMAEQNQIFSMLCPVDKEVEELWNVCFIRQFPWVAHHFQDGLVLIGELDPRGERVQPFALARELGESLGLRNTPTCTARFLGGVEGLDGTLEGTCVSTQLNPFQIRATRAQAARGKPSEPRRGRRRR